jgi:hypothetical protein
LPLGSAAGFKAIDVSPKDVEPLFQKLLD